MVASSGVKQVSEQRHHQDEHSALENVSVVVFVVDGQRYALPLTAAERVVSMVAIAPLPDGPDVVAGVVNVHGDIVPVLDLRRRLGLPARSYGVDTWLLLAQTPQRVVALPVDEVHGVVEVDRAQVVPPGAAVPGASVLAGVAALPDGLLLIDDPSAFLSLEDDRRLVEAIGRAAG